MGVLNCVFVFAGAQSWVRFIAALGPHRSVGEFVLLLNIRTCKLRALARDGGTKCVSTPIYANGCKIIHGWLLYPLTIVAIVR